LILNGLRFTVLPVSDLVSLCFQTQPACQRLIDCGPATNERTA